MRLTILTPEKCVFDGNATRVYLPGTQGAFTVLSRHAPLISSLEKGLVSWQTAEGFGQHAIEGGFVRVKDDKVEVCVELG